MAPSLAQKKLKEGQQFFFSDPPDYAAAALVLRDLTRVAPDWTEAFHWLASALLQQSHLAEAEQMFRRAAELAPSDSRHHLWLGICLDRAGRHQESIRHFRTGLDLRPHYGEADSRLMLAAVLKKLGRMSEAVAEWRAVVSMDPMYPSYEQPIQEAKRELEKHG